MAFGYVHQRVEIVKLGYGLQEDRRQLARLVDHNSRLMYNLSRLESPKSLLTAISTEEINFANHRNSVQEKYFVEKNSCKEESENQNVFGHFLDSLTIKAEAKTRK
jgi:hypothetical protein